MKDSPQVPKSYVEGEPMKNIVKSTLACKHLLDDDFNELLKELFLEYDNKSEGEFLLRVINHSLTNYIV